MSDISPTSDSKSQDLLYPTPKQHEDQQASTSNNPQSWPRLRKWPIVGLAAYCECLTFLVSMMLAPSIPQVLETFRPDGSGKALGSFCVTVYILGFIVGPLILAPLTDHYGRVGIYRLYIIAYLGWTVACARSNSLRSLITFRFLAGCFGGAPMAIGRAVVADLYAPGERPGPMAFYSFGTIMGPTLGPVLGGIVNGNLGWRWVFWLAAILAAVAAVGLLFWLPETHQPTIERLLTSGPHGSHRNQQHHVRGFLARLPSFDNLRRTLCSAWLLPLKVGSHLTCLVPLLMICVFNGTVNMILSSLGTVYQNQFEFPAITVGLSYLGIGFGGISALALSKRLMQFVSTKFPEEKDRKHASLLLLASCALLLPAFGLLWYGWSVATHTHWIVPIIGLYFFGFGYMAVQLSLLIFVVESVPSFSGSAGAAFTVASSIGGSIIPLSTFPIYEKVGYGWGNTIIAGIEILLCAASMIMYLWTRKAGAQLPLKVYIHR